MFERIGLDFETYGATDLPKHGLDRYAGCKTFRPLIASVAYRHGGLIRKERFHLWQDDRRDEVANLRETIGSSHIVAHNAPFERRVLRWLGLDYPAQRFIDSAVIARAAGAGGRLEAAAPQLLGIDKMPEGRHLIRLFSIPGKYQEENGDRYFDAQVIHDNLAAWATFGEYCDTDAELGLRIVEDYISRTTSREMEYQAITMEMNEAGWTVDVDLVEEMQRRYLENQEMALATFRTAWDAAELNLNSMPQLKAWCHERGVKATSFDEKHVAKTLAAVEKKLATMSSNDLKFEGYTGVAELLRTKQILGGSSLKKLQTILDTCHEGKLRDQYLHCGASQTLRTTGRSVQMQNLKRLGNEIDDVDELKQVDTEWDNEQLGKNIRQCFTASDPSGFLIVGDFASVESRGLAYLAGAQWKLDAFRQGQDMYKVLAAKMFGVPYDAVTKPQRQTGKVGELACGYNAGGGAVKSFAEGMGVELEEAEAAKLVHDWRTVNLEIVDLWLKLDNMLHRIVEGISTHETMRLADELQLEVAASVTPDSLLKQHPGARTVQLAVRRPGGEHMLLRYFHGCYLRGRDISYYKPSELKSGDLWRTHYVNPKTKQVEFYKIYGGKLAGILTQSFCREIFFACLAQVKTWADTYPDSVTLIGQFHDEIVLDWKPGGRLTLAQAKQDFEVMMSDPGPLISFPLAAEIKHDYRYTK